MLAVPVKATSKFVFTFLYPQLCVACGNSLAQYQEELCLECQIKIPKTNQHLQRDNAFTNRIAGRFPFETGAALYKFTKSGATQALIHAIKYDGKRDAAKLIGENYGAILIDTVNFHDIDVIVPVPMHLQKKRIRGYNQAEEFGLGLSETMDKPLENFAVVKVRQTVSQTKKNRMGRLENVSEVFKLGKNAKKLEQKHVLLVDDVLTTGATLEACAIELLKIEGLKLSLATIAIAGD
jgi:ComF family protein